MDPTAIPSHRLAATSGIATRRTILRSRAARVGAMWTAIRAASNWRRASRITRERARAVACGSGLSRARANASSLRSISYSRTSMACMSSSIRRHVQPARSQVGGLTLGIDPELASQCRDGPELQTSDGPLLLAHCLRRLTRGESGKEPEGDGFPLLVGQARQGDPDRIQLLANDRDLVRSGVAVRPPDDRIEL